MVACAAPHASGFGCIVIALTDKTAIGAGHAEADHCVCQIHTLHIAGGDVAIITHIPRQFAARRLPCYQVDHGGFGFQPCFGGHFRGIKALQADVGAIHVQAVPIHNAYRPHNGGGDNESEGDQNQRPTRFV